MKPASMVWLSVRLSWKEPATDFIPVTGYQTASLAHLGHLVLGYQLRNARSGETTGVILADYDIVIELKEYDQIRLIATQARESRMISLFLFSQSQPLMILP
jgi:hypothetical protein